MYCIVYGKFLKHFLYDVEILAYKEPSFIRPVNYKDIVTELYNRELSEDAGEDKFIKKTVANVNFGLLEKGTNRNQKSFIFTTPEEAVYYKELYGGSISVLRKLETTKYETENPLDKGLDSGTIHFKEEEVEKKYYILTVKAEATLENGFRYIKELLLQHHNFKMYEAYSKLTQAHITVYSVKTDAFIIDTQNVQRAQELLDFHNDIGGWRVSKQDCPPSKQPAYVVVYNAKTELVNNEFIEHEPVKVTEHITTRLQINDEWNVDEICSNIVTKG